MNKQFTLAIHRLFRVGGFCILIFFSLTGCYVAPPNQYYSDITGFDISNNDSSILYGFNENGRTSIRLLNLKNETSQLIIESDLNKMISDPKFSVTNDSILFIEYDMDNNKYSLNQCNIDGGELIKFTSTQYIIMDAIYSRFRDEILLVIAREYGRNSPIAAKSARGMDIFVYFLESEKILSLTDINAYQMFPVQEIDSNTLLTTTMQTHTKGFLAINRHNPKETWIIPVDENLDISLVGVSNPEFSSEHNMLLFNKSYEIHGLDMDSSKSTLIFPNRGASHIEQMKLMHNRKMLLFNRFKSSIIHFMDLNTGETGNIDLELIHLLDSQKSN